VYFCYSWNFTNFLTPINQAELGVKESNLAELEAASSGDMVRLGASFEAAKGEIARLGLEHVFSLDPYGRLNGFAILNTIVALTFRLYLLIPHRRFDR
jgi:hypothetical protein